MGERRRAITRVFRRKDGARCVSVQMSFRTEREAREVARALDTIKADAVANGLAFSARLSDAILDAAEAAELDADQTDSAGGQ